MQNSKVLKQQRHKSQQNNITMANPCTILSNKAYVYERTLYLVQDGMTLKKAYKIVAQEAEKTPGGCGKMS